ncbi:MAG: hypothetical protein Q4F49_04610 [Pseudoxanthomonas suwonensis]|nr:hypothetical protein [Pseudoxanthomonas suwonensis]
MTALRWPRWFFTACLGALLLLLVLLVIGWWRELATASAPTQSPPAITSMPTVVAGDCPLPPRVARGAAPLQSALPDGLAAFEHPAAQLLPLAGFSVDARVLSRARYDDDREALLAPTDLALAWGRMREDAVLQRLDIRQADRWYHFAWADPQPPLPPPEMVASSANMHMVPADPAIATALASVQPGQQVRIDGWLIEARAADGWRWRSSLRRDDTGRGACEVVYVCAVSVQ